MMKITETKLTIGKQYSDIQLAKLLNVTRQTIYNWRTGKNRPTEKHLLNIKKVFKQK